MSQTAISQEYSQFANRLLLWAVRLGVILVAATPLIVSSDTIYPFVIGKAIYARVVIEITFALWLPLIIYYPRYRLPRSWVAIAFVAWLLVSLAAALMGVSVNRSLWSTYERMLGLFDIVHWFAFALMAASVFRSIAHWRLLLSAHLAVCLIVTLMGIAQYYGAVSTNYLVAIDERIASTIGNPTFLAAYLTFNILIALILIAQSLADNPPDNRQASPAATTRSQRRRRRSETASAAGVSPRTLIMALQTFWLASLILNIWVLWLTGTRGGIVALVAAAIAFCVPYLMWGKLKPVLIGCGVILSIIAAFMLLFMAVRADVLPPLGQSQKMIERISSIGLDDGSVSDRVIASIAGYNAFTERPILGWGPQNFLVAWGKHAEEPSPYFRYFDQAHNRVVEEMTGKGAIGLAAFLFIWAAMARAVILLARRTEGYDQLAVGIVGAAMAAYFVHSLFLFDTAVTLMYFGLFAALAISLEIRLAEQSPQASRGWLPAQWQAKLRPGVILTPFRNILGGAALAIALSALAIAAIALVNMRAYNGAATIGQFLLTDSGDWTGRIAHFNDAEAAFPGLANYPRVYMTSYAMHFTTALPDEAFTELTNLVAEEADKALQAEPSNWQVMLELAAFYINAAQRDPAYRETAMQYVGKAYALAPRIVAQSDAAKTLGFTSFSEIPQTPAIPSR